MEIYNEMILSRMVNPLWCLFIVSIWMFSQRLIEAKTLKVKQTDVCPTNQTLWEKASRELNCPKGRYQCTSNENQTALLEYCYDEPPTIVLEGYCWILLDVHYVDTYNCSGFTEGCPNKTYRSDELYKYCPKVTMRGIDCDGHNVIVKYSISVSNDCYSLISWSWRRNGCPLSFSDEPKSMEYAILKLCNLDHDNTGKYECTVRNIFGEDTVSFTLGRPKITLRGIEPGGQDVLITFSLSEECASLTSLSWKKNDQFLTLSDEPDKYVGGTLDDDFLKICNVADGDFGKYQCIVSNIFGEDTISWVLDEIRCSSKECQSILLCCLLLDDFRICEIDPELWKEKLKESQRFCIMQAKEPTGENLIAPVEYEKMRDHIEFKDSECRLISPDKIFESFIQRTGFLDFFVKNSTSKNIGIYCRSPGYEKKLGEMCYNTSQQQFKKIVQRLKFDILYNNSVEDKTCHHIIEDELSIPKGILSLGKQGITKYLHDLRNGEHRIFVARGMLLGCKGAGKTSLLLRLQGENNPNPPSTRGLEVNINTFTAVAERLEVTVNQSKSCLFSTLNDQDDSVVCLKEKRIQTNANSSEEDCETLKYDKVSKLRSREVLKSEFLNKNSTPNETNKENQKSTPRKSEINEEKVESIDFGDLQTADANSPFVPETTIQTLSESFANKNRKIISFFDFAGEFAYYACHHIYFSPDDFYILVVDITENLDKQVNNKEVEKTPNQEHFDEELSNESNNLKASVYGHWTNLEFTGHWLQSIISHTIGLTPDDKKDEEKLQMKAPLILVATHAEEISKKKAGAYFRDLRDKLPELSIHVDYSNAFSTGFGDDLQDIKNCILKVVQTLPNWGKKIPMSWFYIENQIRKIRANKKIISIWELHQRCFESCTGVQKHQDLITPLKFLNNIGVILFFNEENLRNFVILDVQWFADAFKHLITDDYHANLTVSQDEYEVWKTFNETGLLTTSLMRSIWNCSPGGKLYASHETEIIAFMIRLSLLTEVSKQMFYCPCMNKKIFPTKEFENSRNSSLLCFRFNYFQYEMFHRVIAACSNKLKWKIFKSRSLCMYRTATLFDVNGSKCLVGFYSNNNIVVQFLGISDSETIDYVDVRQKITNVIEKLTEKLVHCTYNVGYMCNKTVFGENYVLASHFIAETEMDEEIIMCPGCGFNRTIIVEEFVWKKTTEKNNQREEQFPIIPANVWNIGSPIENRQVVVAIDIGTTFSSCAFIFKGEIENDPLKTTINHWIDSCSGLVSDRVPTSLLLDKNKNIVSFGFKAEYKYMELKRNEQHSDHYYFPRFLKNLHDADIRKEIIKDITDKKMPVVNLLSLEIKCLYNYCLEILNSKMEGIILLEEIAWVLTVPSYWNDPSIRSMMAAAIKAGICRQNIRIALKSEGASIYHGILCKTKLQAQENYNQWFKSGSKYLLLNVGDRSLDLIAYKVLCNGNLMELIVNNVKNLGGISFKKAFKAFLIELFGKTVLDNCRRKYFREYKGLFQEFETKIRLLNRAAYNNPSRKLCLLFSTDMTKECEKILGGDLNTILKRSIYMGKIKMYRSVLRIDCATVESFLKPVCNEIIHHVQTLLDRPKCSGANKILMVGEFPECAFLQNAVQKAFPNCLVFVPEDARFSVLKGAVLMGLGKSSMISLNG